MTGLFAAWRAGLRAVREQLVRPVLLATCLVAAAALLGSAAPTAAVAAVPGRVTSTVPAADTSNRALGVSPGGGFPYLPAYQVQWELEEYRKAGITWLRLDLPWSVIEKQPGSFDWQRWDSLVDTARAAGLSVLGILAYSPDWARTGSHDHYPPTSPAAFGRFTGAAAAHFKGRIAAYEIWNEPNTKQFWPPAPNPAAYTRLLAASYPTIKRADPRAVVIAGALAPAMHAHTTIDAVAFVDRMYRAGARRWLDAVSVHPYSFPSLPSDSRTRDWNIYQRLGLIRAVMVRNGDARKKIWLTEYGAPTGNGGVAVTESRQSDIVVDGLRLARAQPYLGPMFLFSGRDRGENQDDKEDNFGLLKRNWAAKPAWFALQQAAAVQRPTRVVVSRALATTARTRSVLAGTVAYVNFRPTGAKASRIGSVTVTRTGTVSFRVSVTRSGYVSFTYRLDGRWRTSPGTLVRVATPIRPLARAGNPCERFPDEAECH